MKKVFLLLIAVMFLMGCGSAAQRSEFYKHDAQYKNWEHMLFSIRGYEHPTAKDVQMSTSQGWWGEPIEVPYGLK